MSSEPELLTPEEMEKTYQTALISDNPHDEIVAQAQLAKDLKWMKDNPDAYADLAINQVVANYEVITIPARIAEARQKLIDDIEHHLSGCEFAGNGICATIDCPYDKFTKDCPWWQSIKKAKI